MTKKIFLISSIILTLISCDPKKTKSIPSVLKNIDTVKETDVTRATEFYKRFYIKTKYQAGQERIDSLYLNFDSLQIRYWVIGGLYPSRQLYIIKRNKSVWAGYYYEMNPEEKYATGEGTNEYLHGPEPLEIRRIKKVAPKCGWTKFVDSLISLSISTLPDMSEIPEMKVNWTDAGYQVIEFSSKDKFRFYGYSDPHRFVDKFWQAQKFGSIGSLFYTEFLR